MQAVTELRLLGPVEIFARTGLVRVGEPRRMAVLAALTVDAGRVVPTTTLIDRVWGDAPPRQAARTLGTYITRIRRMLEESFSDPPVTVHNQPGGYRLTVRHDQVDLFRFRELIVQARTPSCTVDRRVDLLRQAVSLHRGDPLTGVDGAWATRTREQLLGELLTARAEWAEAELAVGNATTVLAPLASLAEANPLVEPLVVTLVRALVAAGRPTEALERCRSHGQRLAEEYGTDPSPQLKALYEKVLRDDHQPAAAMPVKQRAVVGARVPAEPAPLLPVRTRTAETAVAAQPVDAAPSLVVTAKWRGLPWTVAIALTCALAVAIGAIAHLRSAERPAAQAAGPPSSARFTTTEEFSGTQLEPLQWHANETQQPNGSSWSPSMVRVNDGELQISGMGRSPTGRGNMAGSVCWCLDHGVIRTYGLWEVRAKFDAGAGYSPVIGLYSDVAESTPGWGFLTMARLDDGERRTMYPVIRGAGGIPVDGPPVTGDFTGWNTYAIDWRADFVTVSLNGTVIFDTRKSPGQITVPTVPMFLYMQMIPGPAGPVPAPNRDTPDQITMHIDWARYTM
jgi:DNA-binding SARP family transcriptional activator/beta-glucanase (GH16 family)